MHRQVITVFAAAAMIAAALPTADAAAPQGPAEESCADRWPRELRTGTSTLCLGTPLIDRLERDAVTLRTAYRLTVPGAAADHPDVTWGVATISATPLLATGDGAPSITLVRPRIEAFSVAIADRRDPNVAGTSLRECIAAYELRIRASDALALLAESSLPEVSEATPPPSLGVREEALLASLASLEVPPEDALAAAPRLTPSVRCTDPTFGDPFVGRGLWIHRLDADAWSKWSPERGWVHAHAALPRPAGAPFQMGRDDWGSLRERASGLLASMRRDPRALEEARSRRFELDLRRATQSADVAPPSLPGGPPRPLRSPPAPAPGQTPVEQD